MYTHSGKKKKVNDPAAKKSVTLISQPQSHGQRSSFRYGSEESGTLVCVAETLECVHNSRSPTTHPLEDELM